MPKHPKPTLAVVGASGSPPMPDPMHGLGDHGRALWQLITSQYSIDDAGGIEILRQICSAADRVEELAAAIDLDGAIVRTRTGVKEHPAVKLELQLRSFIVRGLHRLGLNVEALNPHVGRPAKGSGWPGYP